MRADLKGVSVYLERGLYDVIFAAAVEDGRTLSQFIARRLAADFAAQPVKPESRQIHLEDAIAAAKRGVVKPRKKK